MRKAGSRRRGWFPLGPQAIRNRRRTLGGYVEDFDEPGTKLADFFNSLPDEGPLLAP